MFVQARSRWARTGPSSTNAAPTRARSPPPSAGASAASGAPPSISWWCLVRSTRVGVASCCGAPPAAVSGASIVVLTAVLLVSWMCERCGLCAGCETSHPARPAAGQIAVQAFAWASARWRIE